MDPSSLLSFIPVQYVGYVSAAIAVSTALIAVLPPPKNMRTGYAYVWQVLDFVALNFGHGKTAAKAVAQGTVVPTTAVPPAVSTTPPA